MLDQSGIPSLNMRLSFAAKLLEALLNLHTSGWLHKELRSNNIIFIGRVDEPRETGKNDLSAYSVYIAGYVYSRLDSPGEMTEPLQSDFEADLYRHPSLLSDTRRPYRKSFDIFSVGCTLPEIGFWTSLRRIFENHSVPQLGAGLPRLKERAISEPNISHIDEFREADGDTTVRTNFKQPLDLMALKRGLLCSHTHLKSHGLTKQRLRYYRWMGFPGAIS